MYSVCAASWNCLPSREYFVSLDVCVFLQLSTANARASKEFVMHDVRNQQVAHFYNVVEYFQPSYVLMENVPVSFHSRLFPFICSNPILATYCLLAFFLSRQHWVRKMVFTASTPCCGSSTWSTRRDVGLCLLLTMELHRFAELTTNKNPVIKLTNGLFGANEILPMFRWGQGASFGGPSREKQYCQHFLNRCSSCSRRSRERK